MASLVGGLGGSTLGQVLVRVGVDTKQLEAGLAKARGETEAAGGTMSKFGQYATAAYAAAGVAAVKFAADAVASAIDHEKVLTQLRVAVGDNTAAYEEQATALQNLTGYQDEEVLAADTVLARFKLTQQQIMSLTPLVLDYARATGQDAATSAGSLGKALLGNTRALKAIGIEFTATGNREKDLASITKLLQDRVGGASAAFGETFAGRLAIIAAKFDDVKEVVGGELIRNFTTLFDEVERLNEALQPLIEIVQRFTGSATEAKDGTSLLSDAFHGLAASVNSTFPFIVKLYDAVKPLLPQTIDVTVATHDLSDAEKTLTAQMRGVVDPIDDVTAGLKEQKDATKALNNALPGLIGAVLNLKSAQKELKQAQHDSSTSSAELREKSLAVVEAFLNVKSTFGDIVQNYKDGDATVGQVIEKFKKQAAAAGLTRNQIESLIGVIRTYIGQLNSIPDSVSTQVRLVTDTGVGGNNGSGGGGGGNGGPSSPQQQAGGITINVHGSVIAEKELMEKVRTAAQRGAARNGFVSGF